MSGAEQANQLEINKAVLPLLKKAGLQPSYDICHTLQLCLWAVEDKEPYPPLAEIESIVASLGNLDSPKADQMWATDLLTATVGPEEGPVISPEDLSDDPEGAARSLLINLQDNLLSLT